MIGINKQTSKQTKEEIWKKRITRMDERRNKKKQKKILKKYIVWKW